MQVGSNKVQIFEKYGEIISICVLMRVSRISRRHKGLRLSKNEFIGGMHLVEVS